MIIGFAGKKQAGKSTAAKALEDAGFQVMSFAETLKAMATKVLQGLGYNPLEIAEFENNKELKIAKLNVTWRYLLQTLGTDWGRELIHPELWTLIALSRLKRRPGQDVVFDDVRFENEAALIRDLGGLIIHIVRGELINSIDGHQSENGIKPLPCDKCLVNNGSPEDLYHGVLYTMNEWLAVNEQESHD